MSEKQFSYEVGTYRESKDGIKDQGRDGLLWLPKQGLLAVADGIADKGKGQEVMERTKVLMEVFKDIRVAFAGLLGRKLKSTFAGLQLPKSSQEQAQAIAVGDSSLRLFRDGKLQMLNKRDNLWTTLLEIDVGYDSGMPLALLENSVTMAYIDDAEVEAFVAKLRHFCSMIDYPLDEKIQESMTDQDRLLVNEGDNRKLLDLMFERCRDVVTADLACDAKEIRKKYGEGKTFSVQEGDVLLAHTDGIDVSDRELSDMLSGTDNAPQQIAERLIVGRAKKDDVAVGVVRVQAAS